MSAIPLNSELEIPFMTPTIIREEPESNPYRRHDFHWPLLYQELDQTFQTFIPYGKVHYTQIAAETEREEEILDPERYSEEKDDNGKTEDDGNLFSKNRHLNWTVHFRP